MGARRAASPALPRRLRLRPRRALGEGRVDGRRSRRRRGPCSPARAGRMLGVTKREPARSTCSSRSRARPSRVSGRVTAATSTRATSPSSMGIPVMTVARLLVELTDVMDADDVAFVIHEAAYWGMFSLEATGARVGRANGRPEPRVLEAALRLHAERKRGSRSRLESASGGWCSAPGSRAAAARRRQWLRGRRRTGPACASRSTGRPSAGPHEGRRPHPRRGVAGRRLQRPPVHRGRRRLPAGEGPSAARGAAACPPRCGVGTSTGSILFGTLKRARRSGGEGAQLGRRRRGARRTTWAATASPHSGSGRPNTPASATAGCASRAASTSAGITFSPPVTIVSTLRPGTSRRPRASRRRGRRCAGARRDGRAVDDDLPVGGDVTRSPGAAARTSRCPRLRDGHRGARLGEPVGRRDRPAGSARASSSAGRRARRRASRRAARAGGWRSSSRASWVGTSEAIVTSSRSAGPEHRRRAVDRRAQQHHQPADVAQRQRAEPALGAVVAERDGAAQRVVEDVAERERRPAAARRSCRRCGRRGPASRAGRRRAATARRASATARPARGEAAARQRAVDHRLAPARRGLRLAQVDRHRRGARKQARVQRDGEVQPRRQRDRDP